MRHIHQHDSASSGTPVRRLGLLRRSWIAVRAPLVNSAFVNRLLAKVIAGCIRFIHRTNPLVEGSSEPVRDFDIHAPAIVALWHGQHIMIPVLNPHTHRVVGMFSRSSDAELNARVAEELGLETVRGSGGRDGANPRSKGGARALLALRNALSAGKSVAMIADISKATVRQAGLGIVTLARISGRPVVPVAYASSRRHVLEKSWDKTTINLPFGRGALVLGDPIHVPHDADDAMLEQKRVEITDRLNEATDRAYELVDRHR